MKGLSEKFWSFLAYDVAQFVENRTICVAHSMGA